MDTTPSCHATLARINPQQPWDLSITVDYVPPDGHSHTDSFTVSTADLLVHHLSVLGINTLAGAASQQGANLSPRGAWPTQPASPETIVAAVGQGCDLPGLSLFASGVTGSEMAWRVSALRELES